MVRKKRVRKASRKVSRKVKKQVQKIPALKNKISITVNNLLLFIALSLVSLVLYRFISATLMKDLFQVMAIVFGFVSVAFLITLIALYLIKTFGKK